MGVKYFKLRFNTDRPADRKALEILKTIPEKNQFIKNAILAYEERSEQDIVVERIMAAIRSELSGLQLSAVPAAEPKLEDRKMQEASMDEADAFLESL